VGRCICIPFQALQCKHNATQSKQPSSSVELCIWKTSQILQCGGDPGALAPASIPVCCWKRRAGIMHPAGWPENNLANFTTTPATSASAAQVSYQLLIPCRLATCHVQCCAACTLPPSGLHVQAPCPEIRLRSGSTHLEHPGTILLLQARRCCRGRCRLQHCRCSRRCLHDTQLCRCLTILCMPSVHAN
jgi:hypothetical protein